jgi:hypothetical protein
LHTRCSSSPLRYICAHILYTYIRTMMRKGKSYILIVYDIRIVGRVENFLWSWQVLFSLILIACSLHVALDLFSFNHSLSARRFRVSRPYRRIYVHNPFLMKSCLVNITNVKMNLFLSQKKIEFGAIIECRRINLNFSSYHLLHPKYIGFPFVCTYTDSRMLL